MVQEFKRRSGETSVCSHVPALDQWSFLNLLTNSSNFSKTYNNQDLVHKM
jgi:hypothetical protein